MKSVLFIGNRCNVLDTLYVTKDLYINKVFYLKDSILSKNIGKYENVDRSEFEDNVFFKDFIVNYIRNNRFDLIFSNGCPFILPISSLNSCWPDSKFINIHPSYLPELKGKTPLNSIIYHGYNYVAATMHYMNNSVDAGNIISQLKVDVSDSADMGFIYAASFYLEGIVAEHGLGVLRNNNYKCIGEPQVGKGSYHNRDEILQSKISIGDDEKVICRTINSLGTFNLGYYLELKTGVYKFYKAEIISEKFLDKFYNESPTGTILMTYDNVFIVKSKNGFMKLYHMIY